ncbi:YIP1 family protein [Elizabethkingia miricola]|uniref:YIP1 family protein n=3 Tax=Elizabethkingia miricola TaxID=172045 RepID=A0ABD5BBH3_ELIMR|nr:MULTISPECIES: YIP1 family protein [Elizabethkingia]MDQ8750809.1 YIP1 family protein [Elizabethkingia miricola]OPB86704.1 hypothetical protein BAS06_16080 [Elizabethkingia miricola]PSL87636.1 hypothetical protein C7V10_14270 [Elizabethkingia miricola]QHQ86366.1 hypothetical protein FE632_06040 [Elizabethkingia miricola]UIO97637.1 YIP1 family protein [Elizabethkingia miricola]
MNWKTLFNPFENYSEKALLIYGIIFLCINIYFQQLYGIKMQSIFNEKETLKVYTFQSIIFNTLICNLVGIITLLILGKFINKNTRVIDVVNTILISQIPYILVIPLTQLSFIHNASNNVIKTVGKIPKQIPPLGDLIIITFFGTFLLSIIIYSYILLFKGFKTACNMKKRLHVILFIISVILFTLIYSTSYYEK